MRFLWKDFLRIMEVVEVDFYLVLEFIILGNYNNFRIFVDIGCLVRLMECKV